MGSRTGQSPSSLSKLTRASVDGLTPHSMSIVSGAVTSPLHAETRENSSSDRRSRLAMITPPAIARWYHRYVGVAASARVVTAHQPTYLPWLGLFHKIALSDAFVIFDDVLYDDRDYVNRNRIRGPSGPLWLTVPVLTAPELKIADARIRPNM